MAKAFVSSSTFSSSYSLLRQPLTPTSPRAMMSLPSLFPKTPKNMGILSLREPDSSCSSSIFLSPPIAKNHQRRSFQVQSVAAPSETTVGFEEMVLGAKRKYYLLGGKGGVGKTSCAASLAVKFANNGHPTLVVSTDPAHSLSDSFAQINPEKAREEYRSASQNNGGTGVKDFMDSMGLGMIVEQVMQFLDSQEYNMFTRIVFDTAPTGHTLRLLSLPDFLDASIGKILKLKQKISSATSAIKSVFGQEETREDASDKLERLRERMVKVRELFRDSDSTEFVIVTIPTVLDYT